MPPSTSPIFNNLHQTNKDFVAQSLKLSQSAALFIGQGDLSEFGKGSNFQILGFRSKDIGVRWKMVGSPSDNSI